MLYVDDSSVKPSETKDPKNLTAKRF